MDQGIISVFKRNYRKELIRKFILSMDVYDPTSSATVTEMSKKISVLSAIHMLNSAWKKVSGTCIKNCFIKCKFNVNNPEVLHPENDTPSAPEGMSEEEFANFDNDVAVFEDIDNAVLSAEVNSVGTNEDEETDNFQDPVNIPTSQEVIAACGVIRRFLESKSNTDFTTYYKLDHQITDILCRERKQSKISDYFISK